MKAEQLEQLKAPFPNEALKAYDAGGYQLTSITAAYVIERLSDVFGLLGTGWRYAHSPTTEEGKEVLVEVMLQYRCEENGRGPIQWSRQAQDWTFGEAGAGWSEPISAYGGNNVGGGKTPMSDAMKSAVTAGITKAASRLGIGLYVHKGLGREASSTSSGQSRQESGGTAASASPATPPTQWEWESYWGGFNEFMMKDDTLSKASVVKVTFGKHQGKSLAEIDIEDRGYIRWLSEELDPNGRADRIQLRNAAIYLRACRKLRDEQSEPAEQFMRQELNL